MRYSAGMAHEARVLPSFEALYRQVVALPSGVSGEILERCVLRAMGRPGKPHRFAAQRALRGLDDFNGNLGGVGWWLEVEAEVRLLGEYLAVPDLAGWRVERVPEMPDQMRATTGASSFRSTRAQGSPGSGSSIPKRDRSRFTRPFLIARRSFSRRGTPPCSRHSTTRSTSLRGSHRQPPPASHRRSARGARNVRSRSQDRAAADRASARSLAPTSPC